MKKNYEKPGVILTNERCEGVFMASGDNEIPCRFGRTEANAGSDVCQNCSVSGGERDHKLPGTESPRKEDFTTCIDGKPIKK